MPSTLDTIGHRNKPYVLTGQIAAGNSQTTAFLLANSSNCEFTTVASGAGAILPVGTIPSTIGVFNSGLNALSVYPPVGGSINNGTANQPYSLATGSGVAFWAGVNGNWNVTVTGSGGGGGSGTVNSGTTGQIAYYAGAGTTVSGTNAGLQVNSHYGTITVDAPSAGAVTCNFATTDAHSVTMVASTTITLAGLVAGQKGLISIIQGGSGSYTPSFSPALDWGSAGAPTWSTTVGKKDVIVIYYDGTSYCAGVYGLGF